MVDKYPLKDRTTTFGKNVVIFCASLRQDPVNRPLISQLVRSGTSVGANYHEACGAASTKDFRNKIYIAKKECMETQYWLDVISTNNKNELEAINKLKKESIELGKILSKIIGTINTNFKN